MPASRHAARGYARTRRFESALAGVLFTAAFFAVAFFAVALFAVAFFAVAFFRMVKVTPFSVRKEIEDDQNVALAIVMASVILGMAIIVGMAVQG